MISEMRIFLSAMENTQAFNCLRHIQQQGYHIHDALISYYYLEKGKPKPHEWQLIFDNCDNLMVDSGAHSFQVGKTVDWYAYTERYAQWVADHDSDPRYVGCLGMRRSRNCKRYYSKRATKLSQCGTKTGALMSLSACATRPREIL